MIRKGIKALRSRSALGLTIAFNSLFTLKNMQVEDGKIDQFKSHRGATMGLLGAQIGPGPI